MHPLRSDNPAKKQFSKAFKKAIRTIVELRV